MGKKRKKESITFKMGLYMALLITFLMATVGAANYHSTRTALKAQSLDKGWSIVRSATAFSAEHMQAGNPDLLKEHLENIMTDDDVTYAAIINAAGKIVASTGQGQTGKTVSREVGPPVKSTVGAYTGAGGRPAGHEFVAPIISRGGGTLGYFQLGLSSARQDALLKENALNMLLISLAAIVAGIMLAAVMAGRILKKPLGGLKEATGHIAAGDFSHRVRVSRMDELGELASAFNIMTGHLANLFMSVRTSATELNRSGKAILNSTGELRLAAENLPDSITRKHLEAISEIESSAKKMNRLVDRLNALSLQFKL